MAKITIILIMIISDKNRQGNFTDMHYITIWHTYANYSENIKLEKRIKPLFFRS